MRSLALIFFVLTGLLTNSQCVQNENITEEDRTPAIDAKKLIEGRANGIPSRTGKAISFFPVESASGIGGSGRQQQAATAARRIRFGDDEDDNNYVNTVSNNDIGGKGGASVGSEVEIGERRPVYAYKRPDDGSIYQTQQNSGRDNYYARPYEYSYNNQGQYYNPQPNPSYYSQAQQGNYYRPSSPSAQPPPPQRPQATPQRQSARPPVSQSYHHIPYPQSQGYVQHSQPQYTSQYSTQYQSQYPQQYQQQPYPYSGPPQGPYYNQQQHQQQQQPQRPPQYDNYSPNYPYQQPGGEEESGVGGLLGGLGSLLSGNGLGGGGGGGGGLGGGGNPQSGIGQFGYAIENIVRFDDYQCVPKIVCQMVGNPQRQATLPGWLNAPSLTALISAVPSTSPMLVFGRAALLGLSGGENNCDSSYPRCPRNEDDVLNYLNNHRGGFFRFFNGGASYGDESDYGYDQQQYQQQQQPLYQSQQQYQQQQYQQPQYQQQQQQPQVQQSPIQGLDLGTISSIAEAINGGGGINLSNLGSNLGLLGNLASLGSALGAVTGGGGGAAATAAKPAPQKQTSSLGSNLSLLSNLGSQLGLGNTVSNLLTGIVGARFNGRKARKLSKRSAEFDEDTTLDEILLSLGQEQSTNDPDTDDPPSKKRNLNKEIGDDATKVENVEKASLQKRKKYHQDIEKKEKIRAVEKLLGVQARIINKDEIQAEAEDRIVNGNLAINPENSLLLNPIIFPDNYEPVVHIRPPQQLTQAHGLSFPEPGAFREVKNLPHHGFVFPSGFRDLNDDDRRGGKAFQFAQSSIIQPSAPQVPFNQLQFPENFQNADGIILDIPKPLPLEYYDRTKMIFPDRTGTGNLRFDSEKFNNDRLDLQPNRLRIGRILTSGNQKRPVSYQGSYNENHGGSATAFNRGDVLIFHSNNYQTNDQQQRPQFDFGNRYPIGNNNPVNSNRYQTPLTTNYNYNRYQGSSSSGSSSGGSNNDRDNGQKIYVTNERGIVTYYINGRGEKIAV